MWSPTHIRTRGSSSGWSPLEPQRLSNPEVWLCTAPTRLCAHMPQSGPVHSCYLSTAWPEAIAALGSLPSALMRISRFTCGIQHAAEFSARVDDKGTLGQSPLRCQKNTRVRTIGCRTWANEGGITKVPPGNGAASMTRSLSRQIAHMRIISTTSGTDAGAKGQFRKEMCIMFMVPSMGEHWPDKPSLRKVVPWFARDRSGINNPPVAPNRTLRVVRCKLERAPPVPWPDPASCAGKKSNQS